MQPRLLAGMYEIREEIGSGGGGVVYKAWHTRLQKEVVLKELKMGTAASLPTQRAEADILKTLKHSYLPQLFDFVVDGNKVYTVIDFIPGQSFDKLLSGGRRYPQQQVIVWARQLLEALTYLHSQTPPILHSDIKPANVMLTPGGDICLIDFNISLMLGEDGAVAVGRSRGYASPEQYGDTPPPRLSTVSQRPPEATDVLTDDATELMTAFQPEGAPSREADPPDGDATQLLEEDQIPDGDSTLLLIGGENRPIRPVRDSSYGGSSGKLRLDVRSDIYSAGATLYHLLTGERPADNPLDTKPLSGFGPGFGEALVYIIEKAMHPDPAQRFQTAESMLHALRNIQKLDNRWKSQVLRRNVTAAALAALFVISGVVTFQGTRVMAREKEDAYSTLVYEMGEAEAADLQPLFEDAIALFPQRIDAYHAKAVALAEMGRLEESRDFIDQTLPTLHLYEGDASGAAKVGDMHFIMANSHFAAEDYSGAIVYYRSAVERNQQNPEYYRDFAISLARTGDVSAAQQMLEQAEKLGLGGDSLALLRGEIAYAKGEDAAIEHFRSAMALAGDDYIRYRAYRIGSDVYKRAGDTDSEITLLEEARTVLPPNYINELTERLADAYVRGAQSGGDGGEAHYRRAAELFRELIARGYATFHTRQNLAIVCQQVGEFQEAEEVLTALEGDYPEDYRVPMRLAYLYADRESARPNEQRNYAQAKEAFDRAAALYGDQLKPGASDPEMQMLEELMNQLRQGGWF